MTVEQAVCEHLEATGGVAALVAERVYQLRLPQGATLPAVRVQLIDEPVVYHLRGDVRTRRARVQIDAYDADRRVADPYASVVAVGEAVDAALSGQRFEAGSPVAIEITGAFRQSRHLTYEGDELRLVRMSQDYFVWSRVT